MAAGMRVLMKWRQLGFGDALLLMGHLLYMGYWMVLLFALIKSLGKSEKVTSELQESNAGKLVFASRILFVTILSTTKLSTLFLIQEIFTRHAIKWWFRILVLTASAQALFGSLLLSAGCSSTHILEGKDNNSCPGNASRWIVFTVIEAVLEVLLLIPVAITVLGLQTNLQRKLWAITVFACRLVVWVPAWMHLSFYLRFMRKGRTNIDIVSTIVTEELWVALTLVCASTPVLMRVAKKFTTSGITLTTTREYGSKQSGSNLKRTRFRPDDVTNTSQVDAHMLKSMNEGASIGSNAESQVGIIRHVDFQVLSELK